ncbi:MAG: ComEA family DNA-binding protein [Coriobacteriia bacterium]|nr:ComEA family DNA-binding protein [Coriobacteriia bacterium]MCL2536973.1 ComEA family DNA-binding protein [Coriobacteriia bacterium]
MDDERYERYGTEAESRFEEVKAKLGITGLSKRASLVVAALVVGLLLLALWDYSPGFREMIGGRASRGDLSLIKAEDDSDTLPAGADSGQSEEDQAQAPQSIYVYLSGEVRNPQVYELPAGSRAIDALNAAGGFLETAAQESLNWALPLEDGMHLHVPTAEEFELQGGQSAAASSSGGLAQGDSGSSSLINLNTADSATLQQLPGVGPVTADKIVADREKNGNYNSLEDLTRVSGIGPKRVEGLEGLAHVGP